MMIYVYILIGLLVLVLSILFRVAAALGLTIPLAYALIAPTLFHDWFHSNQALAEGIGWGLVALVALYWVVSLVRKIRAFIDRRREEKIAEQIAIRRIKQAQAEGRDLSTVDFDDLLG